MGFIWFDKSLAVMVGLFFIMMVFSMNQTYKLGSHEQ